MNDSTHQDVLDWVIAAQNGSTEAFRHLHRRFVSSVHGVLLSRFRPSVAEELTQECFLIAFRKLKQLRDPRKFGPWIVAIARRVDAVDERHHYVAVGSEEIVDTHAARASDRCDARSGSYPEPSASLSRDAGHEVGGGHECIRDRRSNRPHAGICTRQSSPRRKEAARCIGARLGDSGSTCP